MNESKFIGEQEFKEKPKRLILEIGAGIEGNQDNRYITQYRVQLPPDAEYRSIHVDYGLLPNEKDERNVIPLGNNTVDEVVISNVLSDLAHFDFIPERARTRAFMEYRASLSPLDRQNIFKIRDDVATFQKKRTLMDIIRVLKPNGILRIYENYNKLHPEVFDELIEWLQQNKDVDFSEDVEEEKRIQPFFDQEYKERVDLYKKYEPRRPLDKISTHRKHNKVYKVIKKPPL